MKTKVFYFALAVVVAAIASSCVKEQFEQPQDKPEVEITGQVFEAVSETPAVKSYLNNMTPTWVEGDEIYVSGSDESATCTFVEGNKFQTPADVALQEPFYAVYPAAEGHSVDRETGIFTATVPSMQKIAKGRNVAQGALVAVAHSGTPSLEFKNAVGLVKLNIARKDIMAVRIEALGENEFVSGKFTMKLNGGDEPEIILVEGVKSVTLNPVQEYGVFEPGEYYAAVLPCNLSGIKVFFTRKTFAYGENGEVTGTGTDNRDVQQQKPIVIRRNKGVDLGTFFTYEISTADELLAWNKAKAKWTVWDVVTLKDNIDCSTIKSEDWTPNEFKGVFDGNNKTIDKLKLEKAGTSAFFSKLEGAEVKDLTFGSGCSFVSTATTASSSAHADNVNYAASLAGLVREDTKITNVVNRGAVTISQGATSGTSGYYVGGICSYYLSTKTAGTMTGCKNYGSVTYSAAPNADVCCAGIVGVAATTKGATLDGCENHGVVKFDGGSSGKTLELGGVAGLVNGMNLNACKNLGSVLSDAEGTYAGVTNMGGIVSRLYVGVGTIQACENGVAGDATKGVLINNSASSNVIRMGGFVGSIVSDPININGSESAVAFKNYGTITNSGESTNWNALGGVVGYIGSLGTNVNAVSYCENHGIVNSTVVKGRTTLGGIVGFIQNAKTNVTKCYNEESAEVKNTADASLAVSLGGIVGRIEATNGANTISDCDNMGAITFAGANGTEDFLSGAGGILGIQAKTATTLTIDHCDNYGDVTKSGAGNTNIYVGGIAASLQGNATSIVSNCINKSGADITNESTGAAGAYNTATAGIVAYQKTGEVNTCSNYGTVTNKMASTGWDQLRVGGVVGFFEGAKMTGCINSGLVSDKSTSNGGCVGGVVGLVKSVMTILNCDNTALVSGLFNNTASSVVAIGGVLGCATKSLTMGYCDNSGDVCQYDTSVSIEGVGGLAGYIVNGPTNKISNCSSNASVTIVSDKYAGAFIGRLNPANGSSVESSKVYGTFNGNTVEGNPSSWFGSSSDYKVTTGITYGTVN